MEEVLLYVTPAQAEAARLQARDGDYGMTLFHNGNTLVHLKPLDRPAPIDQEIFRWHVQNRQRRTLAPGGNSSRSGAGQGQRQGPEQRHELGQRR